MQNSTSTAMAIVPLAQPSRAEVSVIDGTTDAITTKTVVLTPPRPARPVDVRFVDDMYQFDNITKTGRGALVRRVLDAGRRGLFCSHYGPEQRRELFARAWLDQLDARALIDRAWPGVMGVLDGWHAQGLGSDPGEIASECRDRQLYAMIDGWKPESIVEIDGETGEETNRGKTQHPLYEELQGYMRPDGAVVWHLRGSKVLHALLPVLRHQNVVMTEAERDLFVGIVRRFKVFDAAVGWLVRTVELCPTVGAFDFVTGARWAHLHGFDTPCVWPKKSPLPGELSAHMERGVAGGHIATLDEFARIIDTLPEPAPAPKPPRDGGHAPYRAVLRPAEN